MIASEYIGLDLGQVRSGLARASSAARLAEPLESVPTEQLPARLHELAKTNAIAALVVGLPRGLNGQETDQTKWVRQQAANLKKEVGTPIYGQDEALTTVMAESQRFFGKGLQDKDAIAAAIILQDFLDGPEPERVLL